MPRKQQFKRPSEWRTKNYNTVRIFIVITACLSLLQMSSKSNLVNVLALIPNSVANGSWWQIITHSFIIQQPLNLIFSLLFLWWVGTPLEEEMGSFNFVIILLLCTLGTTITALIIPSFISGAEYIGFHGPGAILLATIYLFARKNPNQQFYLMLLLPVRAKYFTLLYLVFRIVPIFSLSNTSHKIILAIILCAEIIGAAVALLYYYLRHNLKDRVREIQKTSQENRAKHIEQSLQEKNRKMADKIAILQKKASLENHPNPQLEEWLKENKNANFDFEVCNLNDFNSQDSYCQQCEAFGHCLAKKISEENSK